MPHANLPEIQRDVAGIFQPPRRMRVSDAARQYVRVATGGGSAVPWDPDIAPYMVDPMNCLPQRELEAVVFVAPARTGKTMGLGDCWLSYAVKCDPGDMMMMFPTEILGADFSKRRLRRLHRHSPEIGRMLSPSRHDDAVGMKFYRNGMILNIAWPTSSQVAQRDIRFVLISDYDSMPDDIDGEGSGFDLGKKRTQAYMSSGMTVVESSPKRMIEDPKWRPSTPHEAPPVIGGVLPLYNRGDRRRWYWQCRDKDCGEWFEAPALPGYVDTISDPAKASETAFVACPHCGHAHTPAEKRALNLAGRWQGETDAEGNLKKSSIASFWMRGCAAAYQSWQSLVLEHLRGMQEYETTGAETKLKTTTNVDQGMPYLLRSKAGARTADQLQGRAEAWPRGQVPAGVRWLQFEADVQKASFVVHVIGHGRDRERWIIDRYSIHLSDRLNDNGDRAIIDPAGHIEDWAKLTDALGKTYELSDGSGRQMGIQWFAVDSGGYHDVRRKTGVTGRAYSWWRALKKSGLHRRVRLVKGEANKKAPQVKESWPDSSHRKDRRHGAKGDVPVLMLNTDLLKDTLAADLQRSDHGSGYIHLPEWLEDNVFEELVAEVRTGKGWERISHQAKNEEWDLFVYDSALSIHTGGDRINFERPPAWAAEWDKNANVSARGETVLPTNKRAAASFKVV